MMHYRYGSLLVVLCGCQGSLGTSGASIGGDSDVPAQAGVLFHSDAVDEGIEIDACRVGRVQNLVAYHLCVGGVLPTPRSTS